MKLLSISKKIWFSIGILITGYLVSMLAGFYLGLKTENQLLIVPDALFPSTMHANMALNAFDKQIKGYNDAILMGEETIFTMAHEKSRGRVNPS